ncbi:hypothetical protein Goari_010595 [Gossypium aridum]|uniref:Uncharacterized protein n=1 Tax=Gossypium aridum TaxID=34290 RepID=A0A7J8Y0H8_GOSAI|nr:hypothetical protein [Gossypium aridum]
MLLSLLLLARFSQNNSLGSTTFTRNARRKDKIDVKDCAMEEELVALSIARREEDAWFLEGSPWTFNNHLLLFHRLKVHDLSEGLMFEMMAKQFGDFLGQFLECDAKSISKGYQSYMRIQGKVAECNETLVLECPGDGNPWAIRHLQYVLRETNLEVAFFMKTKL